MCKMWRPAESGNLKEHLHEKTERKIKEWRWSGRQYSKVRVL